MPLSPATVSTASTAEPTTSPAAGQTFPSALTGPLVAFCGLSAILVFAVAQQHDAAATALVVSSLAMFALCVVSATHLLGWPATSRFVALALAVGWFAEQMGSTDGWFFGRYTYTSVLGPRLGSVPVVIPMMWFVLTYTGYVLATLILWHRPVDDGHALPRAAFTSLIAAMIVTAYDLGADPYLVYVMKAWIMAKTDGAWFGETVQGFVGWTVIGFAILCAFRVWVGRVAPAPTSAAAARAACVPMVVYGGSLAFQVMFGHPVETRSIAVFAMGIPLLCAVHGWRLWREAARLEAETSA